MPKGTIYVTTSEDTVDASTLSEDRPLSFKPFQSARFLVIKDGGLDESKKHTVTILSRMQGFERVVVPFRFIDRIARRPQVVILESRGQTTLHEDATIFGNFNSPLILSGKKAFVVCSADGALSANWTWMGVTYDNGGLYVPPVRVFGRTVVEISINDGVRRRLPNFVVSSKHEDGVLETHHELAGILVRRRLVVPSDHRGFIMSLDITAASNLPKVTRGVKKSRAATHRIRVHFMIDGNIASYGLAAVSHGNISRFNKRHNCLEISSVPQGNASPRYFGTVGIAPSNLRPHKVITDSYDNDLDLTYEFTLAKDKKVHLDLVGAGSLSGSAECLEEFLRMRDNTSSLVSSTEKEFKDYSSSTLSVSTNDHDRSLLGKVVTAFQKTKSCLQYLKTNYDGLGAGISAGLPRFPNYWARDTGWALRGYLAIDDVLFAKAAIDNFLRFQAKETRNGIFKGELPMLISGKAFLHSTTYGSADSTFLFPPAILQYVRSTGDIGYLQRRWDRIKALIDWGFLKDIDGDGLVENDFTGIAEKLAIQDSTWMDHVDRRKSANDIQALFYGSLAAGSELANIAGDAESAQSWRNAANQLQKKIDAVYWNESDRYFFDTQRKDGSMDRSIRPNALVLLLTGAAGDRSKAEAVLSRIEKPDMTTSWGVRTLSSSDPAYRPTFYHGGAVWPLVTGWAALCESRFGRREQALGYLVSMADRINAENGMFAETYRGDRPEPHNSCILQAWSSGMYAWAFNEIMVGLDIDMVQGKVNFEPRIPNSILKGAPVSIRVDRTFGRAGCRSRMSAMIDFVNRKISVNLKGNRQLEINSESFDIRLNS